MRSFDDAARVLGDLECRVMDILWELHPLTVRDVKARLGARSAYTTVMTTLDRLYKKGLLARDKDGLAFVYRPALDRAEYQRRVVEAAVGPLLEQGAGPVLAAFVDVAAGLSPQHLSALEQLIAAKRRQR
ncbi:MAG: BlaI/MecI/CopY family transcriptional regulator [Myxococcales bacterium]|jgi:predicted transcriptional regulator|nr:BlaI/MecI/CopY family transcriptional regulator [Myxococcales bacterium]